MTKWDILKGSLKKDSIRSSFSRVQNHWLLPDISYYSEIKQKEKGVPVLSRYTYGMDYHDVIVPKLDKITGFCEKNGRLKLKAKHFAIQDSFMRNPGSVKQDWAGRAVIQ